MALSQLIKLSHRNLETLKLLCQFQLFFETFDQQCFCLVELLLNLYAYFDFDTKLANLILL